MLSKIEWSGCWEKREGRSICRWMIAWVRVSDGFLGCIAGYSGGGAFQVEKFVLMGGKATLGHECSISDLLTKEQVSIAEDCQDEVLGFHNEKLWLENDTLVLSNEVEGSLKVVEDLWVGGEALPKEFEPLFEKVGLITRPA